MPFDLETAADPQRLRRLAIDPVTRVEGHGKVTLLLDEAGRVQQARLHVVEFRGFEAFIRGRPYWEVPVVVQRLCGICPVSHHLAASKALDAVAGVPVVPPAADALRRLMHHAQVMQSHALHFFHLASPDLLFGFHGDAARRHLLGVAAAHPEIARDGVALRRYGQEVIRATAGKRVHGTASVPGGMNQRLAAADRDTLRAEAPAMIERAERAVDLVERLHASDAATFDRFAAVPAKSLALAGADGALELYDGRLRVCDEAGAVLVAGHDPARYLELIEEGVRPWSYAKFPYLRAFGAEAGWYRVGPLTRVLDATHIATPRAEARRQAFVATGAPRASTLGMHRARMIEMLHAAEVVVALLDEPTLLEGPCRADAAAPAPRNAQGLREGIGVLEAPRGTLIHHYAVDDDDLVAMCNLIVSTTHNNQAMNEAVRAAARETLDARLADAVLLERIEVALRAFDPCLSCATHALGRMPLVLELVDGAGAPLRRIVRDADP